MEWFESRGLVSAVESLDKAGEEMADSCMPGLFGFVDRNKDALIALTLFVCTLLAGSFIMVPRVTGVFHDDAVYVSTARSLAEGQGYRLINLPDSPPQTKYPPLYPVLLAIVWRLWPSFPNNVVAMQWLTLILSAASVGLCYHYVTSCGYFSRAVALIAGLLAASSHALLYYSSLLLSEMPFALFLCAALLALEKYVVAETRSLRDRLFLTLLVALPFLTRSIGVVLVPAALLFLLAKHRFSRLVASGLVTIVAAWFAWALHARQSNPITYYYTSYWDWWKDYVNPIVLIRVCFFNLIDSCYSLVYSGCALTSRLVSFAPSLWPLVVPVALPAGFGLWRGLRQKQLLPWLLLFYLAMVLVWPWPPFRFIIPVLLFLLCYAVEGIGRIFRKVPLRASGKPLAALVSGLLIAFNIWHVCAVGVFNKSMSYPTMATSWQSPARWRSFLDAFDWIKSNTRSTDVIAGYFDSMAFLYTDRKAFRPMVVTPASPYYGVKLPVVTPDELLRHLGVGNGSYVLCTPFDRFGGTASLLQMVEKIRAAHPGIVEHVYSGKDGRFAIYRVQGEKPVRSGKGSQEP